MKIYIILCHYYGCDECGSDDAHIVDVKTSYQEAADVDRKHIKDKKQHLHDFWTEIIEKEI